MSVCPSVKDVGGLVVQGTGMWGIQIGQSANSEWWVASWLQPWSLSLPHGYCDATKRHVPRNYPGIPVEFGYARNFSIARYPSTTGSQVVHCTLIPVIPRRPPKILYNSKAMNAYAIDKTPTNAYI